MSSCSNAGRARCHIGLQIDIGLVGFFQHVGHNVTVIFIDQAGKRVQGLDRLGDGEACPSRVIGANRKPGGPNLCQRTGD